MAKELKLVGGNFSDYGESGVGVCFSRCTGHTRLTRGLKMLLFVLHSQCLFEPQFPLKVCAVIDYHSSLIKVLFLRSKKR